jgi:hypothetical protein
MDSLDHYPRAMYFFLDVSPKPDWRRRLPAMFTTIQSGQFARPFSVCEPKVLATPTSMPSERQQSLMAKRRGAHELTTATSSSRCGPQRSQRRWLSLSSLPPCSPSVRVDDPPTHQDDVWNWFGLLGKGAPASGFILGEGEAACSAGIALVWLGFARQTWKTTLLTLRPHTTEAQGTDTHDNRDPHHSDG